MDNVMEKKIQGEENHNRLLAEGEYEKLRQEEQQPEDRTKKIVDAYLKAISSLY